MIWFKSLIKVPFKVKTTPSIGNTVSKALAFENSIKQEENIIIPNRSFITSPYMLIYILILTTMRIKNKNVYKN